MQPINTSSNLTTLIGNVSIVTLITNKSENLINEVIQNELKYSSDNITNEGWSFLENEAPTLVKQKILERFENLDLDEKELKEELESFTLEHVQECLNDVICEYEQTHGNIHDYHE